MARARRRTGGSPAAGRTTECAPSAPTTTRARMLSSTSTSSAPRSTVRTRCRRSVAPARVACRTSRASRTSRGTTHTGRASGRPTSESPRLSSRRRSGVQPSSTSPAPTEVSASSTCGAMPSPQDLSRGKSARSRSSTRSEGSARSAPRAVAAPAGPAPTTARSHGGSVRSSCGTWRPVPRRSDRVPDSNRLNRRSGPCICCCAGQRKSQRRPVPGEASWLAWWNCGMDEPR